MIAYIALVLSVLNTLMWVAFVMTIKKVFKQMFPMMNLLTSPPISARLSNAGQGGELNNPSGKRTR